MPRDTAAFEILPRDSCKAVHINSLSWDASASLSRGVESLLFDGDCNKDDGKSEGKIFGVFVKDMACSIIFSSSLTLPGYVYFIKISRASSVIPLTRISFLFEAYFSMKCPTKIGTSSIRSLKDGIWIFITFSL